MAVNAVSPDHPVLLRRYDHSYFVNSLALLIAGVTDVTPSPPGGRYEHDPATGKLTGMLLGTAGEQFEKLLPPASLAQEIIGARGVLAEFNRHGITSISDIARVDKLSQNHLHRTYHPVGHRQHLLGTFEELMALVTAANGSKTTEFVESAFGFRRFK